MADPNVTPTRAVIAARQSPGTHLSVELPGLRFVGAGSYGSEGWGFESLRARSVETDGQALTSGNAGWGLCRVGALGLTPARALASGT